MILVDTSVWSLALRRKGDVDAPHVLELRQLIGEGRAAIIGAIRQELLSGVKSSEQFALLKKRLADFPDVPTVTPDYEAAAECFNRCRERGVQGSNTDFLICAMSASRRMPVLTSDRDFTAFARILPFKLHALR
ncbi:MAG: PIN domain-containing protein [Acidobacteriota bacterium]|nr:PIN domain-containing protein [Acidobacteriota bacterium]